MIADHKWRAVVSNDGHYDNAFVYAIKTTGIYCRPSCRSRTPKPENVEYFDTREHAEQAGYRACKRCFVSRDNAEAMIKRACAFIIAQKAMPKLDEVSEYVGLSPNHFQRLFSDMLGISPRSYSDNHRQQTLRTLLRQGNDISGALYDAGFSSSSRVYEFAHRYLGMTPKVYQQGGQDRRIGFYIGIM